MKVVENRKGGSMLPGRVRTEGKKFLVNGKEIWMNGVNTPWKDWDEFGKCFDKEYWSQHYKELKEAGINSSRVWITCSGDVGIEIDENGFVKGATQKHWQDVEALFEIAEANGIYVMATLMSFDHFKDENANHKRYRAMIQNEEAIQSYIDNYVIPFCEKFGKYNSLWSIDMCNEPDWILENPQCGGLDWKYMDMLFSRVAAAIHEHSDVLVTLGIAIVKYNSEAYQGDHGSDACLQKAYANKNAYLDFYSTHYYEWMAPSFGIPFDKTSEEFKLVTDKPVLIGEFPAHGLSGEEKGSKPMNTVECYLGCLKNGWQGIMAWTSSGIDRCGNMDDIRPAAQAVREKVPEQIF